MSNDLEIKYLRQRVSELERQVEQLRLSRRILMNLIERIDNERRINTTRLEKENKRVQRNNWRYAKRLMRYNCYLAEIRDEDG